MINEIKAKVRELLEKKKVEIVIGYKRASCGVLAAPHFITKVEDVEELIWDQYCVYNLANYIKDFRGKNLGIIVKGCDAKSIIVLLSENQVKREDIFIIGLECQGIVDEKKMRFGEGSAEEIGFDKRCKACKPCTPPLYDILIGQKEQPKQQVKSEQDLYDAVRKFEAKSPQERLAFWKEEFSRCIRCYACRQVCPLCYCPCCVADQDQPAWFSKAASLEGNFSWNVTRAMHLAARCIDCGECERACPVGIPLREINKKIEKDIKEMFNYEAASNQKQKPLLSCFDKNDPEDFIR